MQRAHLPLNQFRWTGIDKQGVHHHGRYIAFSAQEVQAYLGQRHIRLLTLHQRSATHHWRYARAIKRSDISSWTRQMATLLHSGLSLAQAIDLLKSHQKNRAMRSLLYAIAASIASGLTLSQSLKVHPAYFDEMYISLLESAEQHGQMADIFTTLSEHRERSAALKRQIFKAALYPSLVLCVAIIVTYIMLVVVIPEFEQLFASFNAKLPMMTQMVITGSVWLQHWGTALMIGMLGLSLSGYYALTHSSRLQYALSHALLRVPKLGSTIKKAALARFCQTSATSLAAGLPIINALQLGANSMANAYLTRQFIPIIERTASGHPLYTSLSDPQIFSPTFTQLVTVGEASGQLDTMLTTLANHYQQDVQHSIEHMEKMLEPLLIVIIGGLIGGLIIAMYLPIFNLAGILS